MIAAVGKARGKPPRRGADVALEGDQLAGAVEDLQFIAGGARHGRPREERPRRGGARRPDGRGLRQHDPHHGGGFQERVIPELRALTRYAGPGIGVGFPERAIAVGRIVVGAGEVARLDEISRVAAVGRAGITGLIPVRRGQERDVRAQRLGLLVRVVRLRHDLLVFRHDVVGETPIAASCGLEHAAGEARVQDHEDLDAGVEPGQFRGEFRVVKTGIVGAQIGGGRRSHPAAMAGMEVHEHVAGMENRRFGPHAGEDERLRGGPIQFRADVGGLPEIGIRQQLRAHAIGVVDARAEGRGPVGRAIGVDADQHGMVDGIRGLQPRDRKQEQTRHP